VVLISFGTFKNLKVEHFLVVLPARFIWPCLKFMFRFGFCLCSFGWRCLFAISLTLLFGAAFCLFGVFIWILFTGLVRSLACRLAYQFLSTRSVPWPPALPRIPTFWLFSPFLANLSACKMFIHFAAAVKSIVKSHKKALSHPINVVSFLFFNFFCMFNYARCSWSKGVYRAKDYEISVVHITRYIKVIGFVFKLNYTIKFLDFQFQSLY